VCGSKCLWANGEVLWERKAGRAMGRRTEGPKRVACRLTGTGESPLSTSPEGTMLPISGTPENAPLDGAAEISFLLSDWARCNSATRRASAKSASVSAFALRAASLSAWYPSCVASALPLMVSVERSHSGETGVAVRSVDRSQSGETGVSTADVLCRGRSCQKSIE
jgi:hypothetical protein